MSKKMFVKRETSIEEGEIYGDPVSFDRKRRLQTTGSTERPTQRPKYPSEYYNSSIHERGNRSSFDERRGDVKPSPGSRGRRDHKSAEYSRNPINDRFSRKHDRRQSNFSHRFQSRQDRYHYHSGNQSRFSEHESGSTGRSRFDDSRPSTPRSVPTTPQSDRSDSVCSRRSDSSSSSQFSTSRGQSRSWSDPMHITPKAYHGRADSDVNRSQSSRSASENSVTAPNNKLKDLSSKLPMVPFLEHSMALKKRWKPPTRKFEEKKENYHHVRTAPRDEVLTSISSTAPLPVEVSESPHSSMETDDILSPVELKAEDLLSKPDAPTAETPTEFAHSEARSEPSVVQVSFEPKIELQAEPDSKVEVAASAAAAELDHKVQECKSGQIKETDEPKSVDEIDESALNCDTTKSKAPTDGTESVPAKREISHDEKPSPVRFTATGERIFFLDDVSSDSSDDSETDEEEIAGWAKKMFSHFPRAGESRTAVAQKLSPDGDSSGDEDDDDDHDEKNKPDNKASRESIFQKAQLLKPEKKRPNKEELLEKERERQLAVENKRRKEEARPLTAAEIKAIIGEEDGSFGASNHWVRRSMRQPCKSILSSGHVRQLLDKLRGNDTDMEVLKMKKYINDPDAPQVVIDAALDALEENTNCQALYIQNFNKGMRDQQVMRLLKVLQQPSCMIWCLNIGETYNVKMRTWKKFAKGLKRTKITHMYASEHTITPRLKERIRNTIRENRKKHNMHIDPDNLDIIVECTHCWWNPINAKALRPFVRTGGYEHILYDKEAQGLRGSMSKPVADTI